jgi:hypothetical protein
MVRGVEPVQDGPSGVGGLDQRHRVAISAALRGGSPHAATSDP